MLSKVPGPLVFPAPALWVPEGRWFGEQGLAAELRADFEMCDVGTLPVPPESPLARLSVQTAPCIGQRFFFPSLRKEVLAQKLRRTWNGLFLMPKSLAGAVT